MKKAISLLSGGLDCCVATSLFTKDYEIYALTFNYGQKAFKAELKASKEICEKMNWHHEVIDLDWLGKISNSSLNTDEDIIEVDASDLDDFEKSSESASNVWVPAYAESLKAEAIIVGWNSEEGLTFPDNSKRYLNKFNELFEVGSPDRVEIKAPCIDLTKEEIVKLGFEIDAPMDLSYSCYKGDLNPCGVCESCMRRKRAFKKVKNEYDY